MFLNKLMRRIRLIARERKRPWSPRGPGIPSDGSTFQSEELFNTAELTATKEKMFGPELSEMDFLVNRLASEFQFVQKARFVPL